MSTLLEQAIAILKKFVDERHSGNIAGAARTIGMSEMTLRQWYKGVRTPNFKALAPVLERLNVQFTSSSLDKDIKFIEAKTAPAGEGIEPPDAERYIAAPLVGEVGAGPGYVPEEEIKSWFLVYRDLPAVRFRRNLLAVEIGPTSTSMQPTLNPGDIVLVDRDDRDVSHPGHMMLVKDPEDAGMIKRVALEDKKNGDTRITFYSDNAAQYPPMVYSLKKDYGGDWEKCIVGRVIWAWTDVREK